MSILTRQREQVLTWYDASSTRGLGGFYLRRNESHPVPGAAFSIPLPRHLARSREHINTQEMRSVEQVLLYWGSTWKGKQAVMHVDNRHSSRNGKPDNTWSFYGNPPEMHVDGENNIYSHYGIEKQVFLFKNQGVMPKDEGSRRTIMGMEHDSHIMAHFGSDNTIGRVHANFF